MQLNSIYPKFPPGLECSLTPRPDQVEDFLQLLQWPQGANYSQVGTGKSLVSYLYLTAKLMEGKNILIVMPPPLLPQYIHNFKVITYEGAPCAVARLHPEPKPRHAQMDKWDLSGWPPILAMSYQMYVKYHKSLMTAGYDCIIADEAHMVSNVSTKNFSALFQHVWGKGADLLLMTATPTTTELRSAYGQIRLRSPKAYSALSQFERMHCIFAHKELSTGKMVPEIVGYKDVETINQHLMDKAVRRRAKDVLSLQELNVIDHQVLLHPKHSELYRRLLEEWMLELGDELLVARNKQALRQMALQIITNLQAYTEEALQDEPVANLLAIADSVNLAETKLLVFCNFRATVEKLAGVFANYNPALIYGDSNVQRNVDKLLTDDTCRVGILNFQSGGAGFNLQSVAHHIVMYEAIGSPGMVEQAIGRAHRGGQEHPVIVWIFRYNRTISTKLFKKNFGRAEDIKRSLSDTECFVDFLTSSDTVTTADELRAELGI